MKSVKDQIKLYICDDNPVFLERMETIIRACIKDGRKCETETFTGSRSLIEKWRNEQADAAILDVDMPGLDGFETAARIIESNDNAVIIFVTNFDETVYNSWEYRPFWFIRKSHLEEFKTAIPKLLEKLDFDETEKNGLCLLKADNKVIEINLNTFVKAQSCRHDLIIENSLGEDTVCRCKIVDAEKQLAPYRILRVQKGVLVNCRFISRVTSREVVLHDGETIPLGRDRAPIIRDQFQSYLRSR